VYVRTILAIAALALSAAPVPAQSRAERRRQSVLEKMSRRYGTPVEVLGAAHAERAGAADPDVRQAFLADVGADPAGRGSLLPVVLELARRDPHVRTRLTATFLLSVLGLEADRDFYLDVYHPSLQDLYADRSDRVFVAAADGANVLAGWYRCDEEVVEQLERTFRGDNLRLAQRAFAGLCALTHPDSRSGVVRDSLREVLDPKTRFGVFDRKLAVRETGLRGQPATPAELAELLFADGTVAVECAEALGRLGDPSVLPALRHVDRTASHALRTPAYRARARLGDLTLLDELPEALESDHEAIQQTLLTVLAELPPSPRVDRVLSRLSERLTADDLCLTVAVTRLIRGDPGDIDRADRALGGAGYDRKAATRVLTTEVEAPEAVVGPLTTLAGNRKAGGDRARAVDRLGELGVVTDDALAVLRRLQESDRKTGLRLRAAVSLLQLGDPDAPDRIEAALGGLDVVRRENLRTPAGTAKRFAGSVLIDVVRRLAGAETLAAIPCLAAWLDPAPLNEATAEASDRESGPKPGVGATRTRERSEGPGTSPRASVRLQGPEWVEHALVRREVVAALGELAQAQRAAVADGATSETLERAVPAPERGLGDDAGVVRNEAVRALARLSGRAELAPGASRSAEAKAREAVEAWLAERG